MVMIELTKRELEEVLHGLQRCSREEYKTESESYKKLMAAYEGTSVPRIQLDRSQIAKI